LEEVTPLPNEIIPLEQINKLKLKKTAVIARPEGPWQSRCRMDCHVATLLAMTRVDMSLIELICYKGEVSNRRKVFDGKDKKKLATHSLLVTIIIDLINNGGHHHDLEA
jgi:hypothetical protein